MRRHLLFIATLTLMVSACGHKSDKQAPASKPKGPAPVFDAIVAQALPLDRNIESPGTILPNETTDIHPEISGRVVNIYFKEGGLVQQGALLIKLFDADLQAQLKKLQVQQKIAEATESRQKELLAVNGTSQQDYDNATLNVSNIKADIELLKVNISKTAIRAPFSGKLGLRNISLGAYVTPASILTNIAQVNAVKVEFAVPEKYSADMKPGHHVQLLTDGSGKTYDATVIATQNTIATDTRNLTVRALVSNAGTALTPGTFVQVQIAVGNHAPAIMVPAQAVMPSTRFNKLIMLRNGLASMVNVQTGMRDSARVEIVSGISEGDTIVTNGLLTIKDKMPLKVKVKP